MSARFTDPTCAAQRRRPDARAVHRPDLHGGSTDNPTPARFTDPTCTAQHRQPDARAVHRPDLHDAAPTTRRPRGSRTRRAPQPDELTSVARRGPDNLTSAHLADLPSTQPCRPADLPSTQPCRPAEHAALPT